MVKYSSPPKQNTIRTSGPNPYNYNVGRAGTLLTMKNIKKPKLKGKGEVRYLEVLEV